MNIIGPDAVIFGVDDMAACRQYLIDFGLTAVSEHEYQTLEGTSMIIRPRDDAALPPPLETATMLRKVVYGTADQKTVDAIAEELGKDREVKRFDDGSIEAVDDLGFVLGFQVTQRRKLSLPGERINSPGAEPQRGVNEIGADPKAEPKPRTLSHVVLFVPDVDKGEAFYRDRLGFVTTDYFTETGPFMRPAGTDEHHTLFLIQTPPFMQGCEHVAFHVAGPNELLLAGTRFVNKGYETFWGPGRHLFGSNWFWYFNSPLGCHIEYDADMDLHDDDWEARYAPANEDTSQLFLFTTREKWFPNGPPED